MNDDYIKRKEALSAIKQMSEEHYPYKTIFRAIRILHHVPTVDVRENVRGEWRTTYLDHVAMGERPNILYCSVCNQCIAYPTNYCPNCGADMRGDKQ